MTYENFKSIILTVLVCISILLTWSIWTYQPSYEFLEKPDTVQEVSIGPKKDVKKIVKPDRMFFHYTKDKHLGTVDTGEIDRLLNDISKWNFTSIEDVSDQVKNFSTFVHNPGNAVIHFSDSVPMELYRTIIDVKDKDFPNFFFDRIVIDVENIQKEQGYVYFVSEKERRAYKSHVASSFVNNFKNGLYKNAEFSPNFADYFSYRAANETLLFLPAGETDISSYQYLLNPLDSEKFKFALFKDPGVVQRNYQPWGEEYTNGSSLLRIYQDKNILSYVNPVGGNDTGDFSKSLLKRSIDFVNEHGGWTDNYRYVEMDEAKHKVLFRLYDSKGYPIFSENNISEISQTWGQNEINEYIRSNFYLGLQMEATSTILRSGQQVMEYLESLKGFDREKLQDVVIGYTMTKDPQTRVIYLEPSWYYQYDHSWKQVTEDEPGGRNRGLE